MKRYSELAERKGQNINPSRAQKLNKIIIGDYFTKLGEIIDTKFKKPIYKDL